MADVQVQYIRNNRSGEHHKAVIVEGGSRLTAEACNLDDAGDLEDVTQEAAVLAVQNGGSWCGHCCSEEPTFDA